MRKKVFGLLMALLMIFSMIPSGDMTAFAVDESDPVTQDEQNTNEETALAKKVSHGISILSIAPPSSVNISGTSNLSVATGAEYTFAQSDNIEVTGDSGYSYRAVPVSVTGSGVSYTFTHTDGQDDYPTNFTPAASDASKTYTITYRAQYFDTDDDTWMDVLGATDFTVTLGIVGAQSHEVVVGDNARVSSINISVARDGTPVWDANDDPGNDSGPNNGIVRTFDNIDYSISWTTEAQNAADTYEYGRTYFEVELPTTKDKATFDTDTMASYMQNWNIEESGGKQILKFYYESRSTDTSHAMPALTQITLHVKVLAAANGDTIKPTVTASVEYYEDDNKSNPKTSGTYDVPRSATADDVKVTAAPSYNVQLKEGTATYSDIIANFDFTTGNDKALDKGAGNNVLGRLRSYGITLQLYNPIEAKGLRGIEMPKGDITFDIDLSQIYETATAKDQYNVQAPLVWTAGPNNGQNANKQDDRDLASYTSYLYPVFGSPQNKTSATGPASPTTGTTACWDGGNWTFTREGDTLHVTVSNYVMNTQWFPNANAGNAMGTATYFDPKQGVKNIGCFSGGELFLVFPFGGDSRQSDEYYPNKYGDSGSIKATIVDKNFSATSLTQSTTTQANTEDDQVNVSMLLTSPGSFEKFIRYTEYSGNGNYDVDGFVTHVYDGGDVSAIGNKVGISWQSRQTVKDLTEAPYAVNNLLLFDDEALVPTGDYVWYGSGNRSTSANTTLLYATKADGSGWVDDDEMKNAKEEDLVYYTSLGEIPNGHVCVGILAEVREDLSTQVPGGVVIVRENAGFQIRADASIAGKVYMATNISRVWTKSGVEAVMAAHDGVFPSRANMSVGETIETAEAATKPLYDTTDDVRHHNYEKAWYDESGFHPGSGTEYLWGDSLYLQPYKMAVQKVVLQKDGPGGTTVNFNLQNGESVVDYRIKPRFDTGGVTFDNFNTTVTLTDTLPEGITYKPGSAYYGGTYTQNTNPGLPGTHTGGVSIEPASITVNTDGTTTLVWEIEDVPVGSDMEYLYFSCDIDQSIERPTTFVNTVTVKSTEDIREPAAEKNNLDTATIAVAPSMSVVVKKTADQMFHDREDDLAWTLKWTNTGSGEFSKLVMMESLPYDGDDYGTHLSNGASYDLHEDLVFTFPSGKSASDYRIYYTTDTAAHGKRAFDLQNYYDYFTGETCTVAGMTWTHVGIDGDRIHTHDNTHVTAFVILGSLGRQEILQMDIKLRPNGFKPGDVIVNCISANDLSSTSPIYIVDRILRGTVWIDADVDGERQSLEERVPGVKVALKVKDGNDYVAAKDANGDDYIVTTDTNGNYEFTGLAAGDYLVEFTNNGKNLGTYKATVQNASGVDASVNSDATPKYETELFADIEGINMPDAGQIISTPYIVRYQDLGIYRPDITVTKEVDASNADDEDAELAKSFLFKVTVSNCPADESYDVLDADGEKVGTVTGAQLASGYEFSLKDSEARTIEGVPADLSYKVEEYDYETYGYKTTTTGDATSGTLSADKTINFKNTFDPETVERKVEKEWSDDNASGIDGYSRPASVTVDLYAGTVKKESKTVSGDAWTASFIDLPKYDYENAVWPTSFATMPLEPINYTIQESKVGDETATTVGDEKRFYLYSDSVSVNNAGEEFAILGYFVSSAPTFDADSDTFKLTNTFTPATEEESGTAGFNILKANENGKAITGSAATFKLVKNGDDGSETEIGTTSTSTTDGKAKFGGLTAGKYTLTEETAPTGYVKDDASYTITIDENGRVLAEVDKDNNKNIFEKLFSFLTSPDSADWDDTTLTLTVKNTAYTPVTVNPPIEKKIEGATGTVTDEFTFTFKPISNTVGINVSDMSMPDGSLNGQKQITKSGAGEYEFGEFALPLPGTYVYQMSEESGDQDYEYDDSTYTVTYVVTAEGTKLSATTTITLDGEEVGSAVFTNIKKPADVVDSKDDDKDDEVEKTSRRTVIKTGDPADLVLWGIIFGLSVASLVGALGLRRKYKKS